jgi:hypothetical protein
MKEIVRLHMAGLIVLYKLQIQIKKMYKLLNLKSWKYTSEAISLISGPNVVLDAYSGKLM